MTEAGQTCDVVVVGSGMAGLACACLLARDGKRVTVLEQNWLPGGCSSSYPRNGYIFESGATTLVGLDEHMPLRYLLDTLGISFQPLKLEVPMQVHLADGTVLTRYPEMEKWVGEAERVFGPTGQRAFWEECFRLSQKVWRTSLLQKAFPPSSFSDVLYAAKNVRLEQLGFLTRSFSSVASLLKKHGLEKNLRFVDFVNQQLLITAQNHMEEVNVPFGAAALCYTQYGNYYVPGGFLEMVKPLVTYLEGRGSEVRLRSPVMRISKVPGGYRVDTERREHRESFVAERVVCAIPINNALELFEDDAWKGRLKARLLDSPKLHSAFQMGLVFKKRKRFDCLHHQIHLASPLPVTASRSIFLSLSHPDDTQRCGPTEVVASVSTHVPDPARCRLEDKAALEAFVLDTLEQRGFLSKADIVFQHASTPGAWQKWTRRAFGFVGGYPQYLHIKPWQMLDARLDKQGAYLAGDSAYPGQGIPGATLSGIIAYEKMRLDG